MSETSFETKVSRYTLEYLKSGKSNDLKKNEFGDTFLGEISRLKSSIKDFDKEALSVCFSNTYQALSTCGENKSSQPVEEIIQHLDVYFSNDINNPPKTHLIVGCKGVGKSTLMAYLLKVAFPETDSLSDVICIKVDAQNSLKSLSNINTDIIFKINKQLNYLIERKLLPDVYTDKKLLRTIFSSEIRELSAQNPDEISDKKLIDDVYPKIINDKKSALSSRLSYIANNFKLCLILDNVDHSDSINTEKKIFKVGKSIIQGINCKYIISLRRPTLATHFGTLTRDPYNLTLINPPLIEEILKKKVKYYINEGDISEVLKNGTVEINASDFSISAFNLFNREVYGALNLLCNGNIRLILTSFINMLCSGHLSDTNFYETVLKYAGSRNIIEKHDIKKIRLYSCLPAIITPNNRFYVEKGSSLILNIFDNGIQSDHYNCVIRYRVLTIINNATIWSDTKGHQGGIQYVDLVSLLKKAGYNKGSVKSAISQLAHFQLIRSNSFKKPKSSEDLVITYSGTYYLTNLISMYQYIQTVYPSTYLPRKYSKPISNHSSLEDKFSQLNNLVDYIISVEQFERTTINKDFYSRFIQNNFLSEKLSTNLEFAFNSIKGGQGAK